MVPLSIGSFDLDDYIDYLIAILPRRCMAWTPAAPVHTMGVCQPAVPADGIAVARSWRRTGTRCTPPP